MRIYRDSLTVLAVLLTLPHLEPEETLMTTRLINFFFPPFGHTEYVKRKRLRIRPRVFAGAVSPGTQRMGGHMAVLNIIKRCKSNEAKRKRKQDQLKETVIKDAKVINASRIPAIIPKLKINCKKV